MPTLQSFASLLALPEVAPPQTANPLRALVVLDPPGHTTFTAQGETRTFEDGSPPFVKRPAPIEITNPIERTHQLALDFMDGFRAGAPVVKE